MVGHMASLLISIKHLDFGYNKKQKVLQNLSWDIPRGCVIGVVGKNGSGKSTLLRLLALLEKQQCGTIQFFKTEKNPQNKSRWEMRRHISYLAQTNEMDPMVTAKNIIRLTATLEGLKRIHMREFPDISHIMDAKMSELSIGEQRIVQLYCATIKKRDLYLFDEPTANLDPKMTQMFWHIVHRIAKEGKTCIITSHLHRDIKDNCSIVYELHSGKIKKQRK
jgi:ABC-2 type transport system ATP-binding protein